MSSQETTDFLFLNGRILTLDKRFRIAEGVAVRGDRVSAIGKSASLKKLRGPKTEVIDLKGRTLLPGFVDSHAHMDREGLKYLYPSLAGARSIADIQAVIRREEKRRKPGEWIVTMPLGEPPFYFDPLSTLRERRPPRREELDAVAPKNPIYIRGIWGYWSRPPIISVANSLALKMAGITRETRAPHGGIQIEKDPRSGEPTGVFRESHFIPTIEFTLFKCVPRFTLDDRIKALRHSMQIYNANGITSVYEGHGVSPEVTTAYREIWARGKMTVRAYLALSPTWRSTSEAERIMASWSVFGGRGLGDSWLKFGGIFLEHGGIPRIARPFEHEFPYTGWAGFTYRVNRPEEYRETARLAVQNGLRINTIVINDVEGPLKVLEHLAKEASVKELRCVFVHVKYASARQIRRMRRLDIRPTVIPLNSLWVDPIPPKGGLRLASRAVPLRSFLRSGLPCALATDNVPPNPMDILWAAEARKERTTGKTLGTRERVPRRELLRAFTNHGAYLSFEENEKGSLEPGKFADLVILSEDPLSVSTEGLQDIEVLLTMAGGKVVHQKRGAFFPSV